MNMLSNVEDILSNAAVDKAIAQIEEYVIALKSMESNGNDYRAGYIEGMKRATEVLKDVKA